MIKAIETHYAGCRFRSRLEARVAVMLDALDITWQYEPEGYATPFGGYLPDFWLPADEKWIEVKGPPPRSDEVRRCTAFAREQWAAGRRFMIIQGELPRKPAAVPVPDEHGQLAEHVLALPVIEWSSVPSVVPEGAGVRVPAGALPGPDGFIQMYWMPHDPSRLAPALAKARKARFEHGERG